MDINYLYPGLDNKKLKEMLQYTASVSGISKTILEKDLYMTGMLMKLIHSLNDPDKVYFKGGTAMSKCHKILKRFSEDCDLFVFTGIENASRTQECNLNTRVTNTLVKLFKDNLSKDENGSELSKRGGDYNRICLDYEKTSPNENFKPHVEFEITSSPLRRKKGYYINSQKLPIQPLVGEILYDTGKKDVADDLSLYIDTIQCTTPHKSICDKISRLIRISYNDNTEELIKKYIRDFYDLAVIIKTGKFDDYLLSSNILQDMLRTNEEDSMRKNSHSNENYGNAIIFNKPELLFEKKEIREAYQRTISSFCFDPEDAPQIDEIVFTLKKLHPCLLNFDEFKRKTIYNRRIIEERENRKEKIINENKPK